MAFSSQALSVGGALSSAAGAYYDASSQKTAYNSAAATAEINARIAELRAQSQLKSGQREEQKQRLATANLKGQQRAGFAANGVDLGEGSAAQVLAGTDVFGDIDALAIRQDALSAAGDSRMERVNYENDARTARNTARGISPSSAAFTSLLGSATQIADKWYALDKSGASGGKSGTKSVSRTSSPGVSYQSAWSPPVTIGSIAPGSRT